MPNPSQPRMPRIVSTVPPSGPRTSQPAPADSRLADFARRMVVGVLVSVLIVAVAYFCWRGVHVLLQAFAGMLFATSIGIFFIPLFFRVIAGLAEGRRPHPAGAAEPLPSPASPESR